MAQIYESRRAGVKLYLKSEIKKPITSTFKSRGRGDRTPVNGFGDRRTTAVLFPYEIVSAEPLTKAIIA